MVFSQTSLDSPPVLKVVNLDRLKTEKNNHVNGQTGVITDGYSSTTAPSSPVATTSSFAEVYLKSEPLFESAMLDYELYQDLVPLPFDPAKEEVAQTIDSPKQTDEKALKIDTPYTTFSPQGWTLDVNSQHPQAAGLYNNISSHEPLSPNDKFLQYDTNMSTFSEWDDVQFKETFLDISKLPVVIGDLSSEMVADSTPWQVQDPVDLANTQNSQYYHMNTQPATQVTAPFIDAEDSYDDLKFGSVIPREVESNNVVVSEFIINQEERVMETMEASAMPRKVVGLSVDVSARAPAWPYDTISTPEVLSYVEQLEKEKCSQLLKPPEHWPAQDVSLSSSRETFTDLSYSTPTETYTTVDTPPPPPVDYEPITPKSESHLESDNDDVKSTASKRRRKESDESDETYTPYSEQPPRKYRKRKPSVPIKDMILALEGQPKARRGRPPKRRESTVSSVCSVDDNSSNISTQEFKYRELRDKNNEASKRSRMNRKLKELQMEQLADELEEKNKKLRVRADILEEMTKRLKNELMSAILKSK